MTKPKTFPHRSHDHHSETAWIICEHGVERWLELQIEDAEEGD